MSSGERSIDDRLWNGLAAFAALAFATFLLVPYTQIVQAAVSHATMTRFGRAAAEALTAPPARDATVRRVSVDEMDLLAVSRAPQARRRAEASRAL